MARYFLDSSALVKRYHVENGTADLEQLFKSPHNQFLISRLAIVEVHSSFARLVREQVLSAKHFVALTLRLEADVAAGLLDVISVTSQRFADAEQLFATHGLVYNLRSLDAIHLATALAVNRRTPLTGFVAADRKLLDVASSACGLKILPVG